MANLSEYIQCASSDTQPPMLDRIDFASWQQCIRLYCRDKENGVNILKSIDEGPFQMGTFWETLAEGNEGLPKDIYTLINHNTDAKDIWDNVKMLLEGSELTNEESESQLYDDFEHFCHNKGETIHDYYVRFTKLINDMRNIKMTMPRMQLNSKFVNNMLPEWGRFVTAVKLNKGLRDSNYDQLGAGAAGNRGAQNKVGNANPSQARQIKCYNCNGIGRIARNCTQPKQPQNSEYFKDKMLLMQAQENRVALDEEHLVFIVCGQDNVVDEDVDEQSVHDLALNVDNVFQADDYPVYDEASPSYDSDILSEVPDRDNYQDAVCKHHEVHEMHDDVQPNYVADSHADYTSDSNMILYAYVSANEQNKVVNASLTAELATYKEQVELYERRAKFDLTEREQKIEEQLRIVINDRNIKEENLIPLDEHLATF
ncbi:retrovirus-related pol polyprotein from transposon TNT 1-94 [Tanacetum coccineum]